MGKKGNWFSAVKKALNSEPKESGKSKKKWYKKNKRSAFSTPPPEPAPAPRTASPAPVLPTVVPHIEPQKVSEVGKEHAKDAYTSAIPEPEKLSVVNKEQTTHAYNVALATAKASEAAAAAAQAAAEVVRLTNVGPFVDESLEELAAIKVQTAFRGYMARRTLHAIRGLMRLKSMMQGNAIKRQTTSTLKCMQTLARMQSQIRDRRLRMAEEINLARQIQHKNAKEQAKELEKLQRHDNGWDSSGKTKQQIEAKLQSKHEAAMRRERTLAYAFSHQETWKASGSPGSASFMDPNNPHWGWSWLERWLAAKPWETATMESSYENSPQTKLISGDEILKSYARRNNPEKPFQKHPRSSNARLSTLSTSKLRSPSPKASPRKSIWGQENDDITSMISEQSRTSVRDDESVASSAYVPSYMAPTQAAKARSRVTDDTKREKSVTPDRSSVSSAKKRISHLPSPVTSRRSSASIADVNSISDNT